MPLNLLDLFHPAKSFTVAMEDINRVGTNGTIDMSTLKSKGDDPEVPMLVDLITDKLIEKSKLQPVYDSIPFSSGDIPTPGGLFSKEIFGTTVDERKRQYAYIELHGTFFHPYVYEILKSLMPKRFEKCASGVGSWKIDETGKLVEVKDLEPGEEPINGLNWLIENYDKLVIAETGANVRSDRIKFLKNLTKDEIFISKWIVIPVFYRDVDAKSNVRKLPIIDTMYANVIRLANSIKDSPFAMFDNQVRYNLMQELIKIRKFGQDLIKGKGGFFHKSILGKSIDRGSRDVISVPTMTHMDRPEDNSIDIIHVGIPLEKCLIIGFDFVTRYVYQFFEAAFKNVKEMPVYKLDKGDYVMSGSIKIKDQMQTFTPQYIEKRINRFKNSPSGRFDPIEFEAEDGKKYPMHLSGQFAHTEQMSPLTSTILNRPLTWTDLFYQAAVNTLSDKWVYVTRYPVESHSSIFPVKCTPLSTIKTIPAYIGNQFYSHYPYIDTNVNRGQVGKLFNGTVAMSNMFLDAIGGDYDGDQTSQRLVFTLEANLEAEMLAYSVKNFVSPGGKMLRKLGNEAYLTFYNMTRRIKNNPTATPETKTALLKMDASKFTVTSITNDFGNTLKASSGKAFEITPPKYDVRAEFTLAAGEYINKEEVHTTVGIFLFNKLMVEGTVDHLLPNGYLNETITKSKFEIISDAIAKAIMNKKIQIDPTVVKWLKDYEFWGLKLVTIFSPSYSIETIMPNAKVQQRKKELLANAKDQDLDTLVAIEEELIKLAGDELEGTDGKQMFNSGARGSFNNDYKNMAISIGPVQDPSTGEYSFMSSNYMGGISKKDLVSAGNIIVNAEYPKAIGTAQGGYMTKQFYAVFQSMQLGDHGSDCGTKTGLTVTITKETLGDYIDQYIMDSGKLILIDENLPSSYFGKKIMIRSPMYCIAEHRCNKCMGERFYKVDINNMGLVVPALSGRIQNASLKLRHNMKVSLDHIDEKKILK